MSTINAHKRTLRIVASQLRVGDRIVKAGNRDHRARLAVVTSLVEVRGRIQVVGTALGAERPHILFVPMNPDLPMVVEREPSEPDPAPTCSVCHSTLPAHARYCPVASREARS